MKVEKGRAFFGPPLVLVIERKTETKKIRPQKISSNPVAYAASKRSAFITLLHAAAKSFANFSFASELP
jgi:hypothetical protein